jgi:peptidoglycan/LPS O-acetylase OafA/YrhL
MPAEFIPERMSLRRESGKSTFEFPSFTDSLWGILLTFGFFSALGALGWIFDQLHHAKPLALLGVILAGLAMYVWKRWSPAYYGLGAVCFGVALAIRVVFYQWSIPNRQDQLARWMALGTCVYAISRGIGDFQDGRKRQAQH